MAYLSNMELFYRPTCPYCQKVLAFMQENDIAMEMKNTLEPGVIDILMGYTNGNKQVPCLVINGVPMHESDDIIAYLQDVVTNSELG